MSNNKDKTMCKSIGKSKINTNWERALRDAKERLNEAKRKVSELEGAVDVFQPRIKDGDPWPGDRIQN